MAFSKFLKNLFTTGFTQIIVLSLGVILLRIMAEVLNKEYFGVFMVIRRVIGIGAPLITLNIGVGLARYVSYERENENQFLNVSLLLISFTALLVIIISFFFRLQISLLLFNTSSYGLFAVLTAFFLLSYGFYTISYAFFRGRQEMGRANRMQVFYYFFPVIAGLLLWQLFQNQYYKILSFYFFSFALWGFFIGIYNIRQNIHFGRLPTLFRNIQSTSRLFTYSIYRIPSGFFLALIFGIPVFIASNKMSLTAAGYVGIAVAVIRMMELFATPFNLLFLPKFADIKRNNIHREIRNKVSIVINFILTALPFFAIAGYGLAKYVVIIFFGKKFISAIPGVSIIILISFFYVSYVLVRGILDGLFSFPYVNVICFAGLLTTAIGSFLFHGSMFVIVLNLGMGLFVMGTASLFLIIKITHVPIKKNDLLLSIIIGISVFALLLFLDEYVDRSIINEYVRFGSKLLCRTLIMLTLFWFYWKPKSMWVKEVILRIR